MEYVLTDGIDILSEPVEISDIQQAQKEVKQVTDGNIWWIENS